VIEEISGALQTILAIPFVVAFLAWAIQCISNPGSTQTIQKAGDLIAQAAVPWWIPILQFLTSVPVVGGIAAIIFLIFFVSKR
jgi:hypothetical protein